MINFRAPNCYLTNPTSGGSPSGKLCYLGSGLSSDQCIAKDLDPVGNVGTIESRNKYCFVFSFVLYVLFIELYNELHYNDRIRYFN